MDDISSKVMILIVHNKLNDLIKILQSGFDPNFEGGWPIRTAARHGFYKTVKTLIQFGADPHLLGEAGASTLQLAVYSGQHWNTTEWSFLLSYCDSSQLADAAAVAIVFQNVLALQKILDTGRCNTNIPTTLTGKTLEHLAHGYKLSHLLKTQSGNSSSSSPRNVTVVNATPTLTPSHTYRRNLSPSVARFFDQTASQSSLSPQRQTVVTNTSPISNTLYR